jgi:hypothetical protein
MLFSFSEAETGPIGPKPSKRTETPSSPSRLSATRMASLRQREETLLQERQALLQRKFTSSLTPQEERRLEFVRWNLDQIEEMSQAPEDDRLEDTVRAHERLAEILSEWTAAAQEALPKKPRPRRTRR